MTRALTILLVALLAACERSTGPVIIAGPTMGSHYSVKLLQLPENTSQDQLQRQLQVKLDHIEQVASTWKSDSELSRFNQAPIGPFAASETLRDLLRIALRACDESGGALDVTVGPLVDLWGFGPQKAPAHSPTEEQVEKTRANVGCRHLAIEGMNVVKTAPVRVDLSSVTQGYAGVKLAELLDGLGVGSYLIDLSGELVSKGTKEDGSDWRIAVEVPQLGKLIPGGGAESVQKVVALKGKAIATSGDYRNFLELDGKTVSHIIDPITGRPVAHGLASVTVLDDNLAWADAMSTALMVMGPEKGLAFANARQMPVLFVVRTQDGFSETMTPSFAAYVVPL